MFWKKTEPKQNTDYKFRVSRIIEQMIVENKTLKDLEGTALIEAYYSSNVTQLVFMAIEQELIRRMNGNEGGK